MSFETTAIHAGGRPDRAFGAISTPIYQSSTFAFENVEDLIEDLDKTLNHL